VDNIKMDLGEIALGAIDWTDLTVVDTVKNLLVP
jgi:hypothetical protein